MATVRIYYSREDSNYADWNLYYFPGEVEGDDITNLFPDYTGDLVFPYYPRIKKSFTVEDNLGYVDIETNNSKKFSFYIKSKDMTFDYDGSYCEDAGNLAHSSLCLFHIETGYIWQIDTNLNPYTEFYVKNTNGYLYEDSSYTTLLPQFVGVVTSLNENDDIMHDSVDIEHGQPGEFSESENLKIYYSKTKYYGFEIPDEAKFKVDQAGNLNTDVNAWVMLHLRDKSFTIGEDMQLSIDAAALQAEKDDAKAMLEKAVANSLFKLGEDVDAFDEDAFLADVDGYKDGKGLTFHATIDYLKECIDNLNALA